MAEGKDAEPRSLWWRLTSAAQTSLQEPKTITLTAGRASDGQPSIFRSLGECLSCTELLCLRPRLFPRVTYIPWLMGSEATKSQPSHPNTGQLWRVIQPAERLVGVSWSCPLAFMTAWLLPLPNAASFPSFPQCWFSKHTLISSCKLKSISGSLFRVTPPCNNPWLLFWAAEQTMGHLHFAKLAINTWSKLRLVGIHQKALYLSVYPSVLLTRQWCLPKCSLYFICHCVSFQVHNSKWNLDTQQMYVKWTNKTYTYFNIWYSWPCSSSVNYDCRRIFVYGHISKSYFFRKCTKQTAKNHVISNFSNNGISPKLKFSI